MATQIESDEVSTAVERAAHETAMGEIPILQLNGPYLRIVLPDPPSDWQTTWNAVAFEIEDGVERVELIAPRYREPENLRGVMELSARLRREDITTHVEWIDEPPCAGSHRP